jgi:hypothetical protein
LWMTQIGLSRLKDIASHRQLSAHTKRTRAAAGSGFGGHGSHRFGVEAYTLFRGALGEL